MKSKKKSITSHLKSVIVKFDVFGRALDEKHNHTHIKLFKTIFGALLSVSFIVILATYTVYKFDNMRRYNDTNIQQSIQENYYTDRHPV